jgi:hypothetical protein
VATNPNVERKGATVPYTSLNGDMFSYLSKCGKLALSLPTGERTAFLKKYKAKLCEAFCEGDIGAKVTAGMTSDNASYRVPALRLEVGFLGARAGTRDFP